MVTDTRSELTKQRQAREAQARHGPEIRVCRGCAGALVPIGEKCCLCGAKMLRPGEVRHS